MTNEPHQKALLETQKLNLDEQLDALTAFIETDTAKALRETNPQELERLHRQHGLMEGYSRVLGERIAAFTEPKPETPA